MTADELRHAALALEPAERAQLAAQLLASLADETLPEPTPLSPAWHAELRRRSASLDAGTAELVDWSEVRSRIAARRTRP